MSETGGKRRGPAPVFVLTDEARRRYESGEWSAREVAAALGCSPRSAHNCLRRAGVRMRGPGARPGVYAHCRRELVPAARLALAALERLADCEAGSLGQDVADAIGAEVARRALLAALAPYG